MIDVMNAVDGASISLFEAGRAADGRKLYSASKIIQEFIFAAEQMRIDLNITRSNIMAEIESGRDKWDGVPEVLEHRISMFDAALSRVRGAE